MQVNVLEAKNRLSELLRSAERGEDVVIANRGRGVARLVPLSGVEEQSPVQPGQATAFLSWLEQHPWPRPGARRPTAQANARRHAEIQARIEAQRSGWE